MARKTKYPNGPHHDNPDEGRAFRAPHARITNKRSGKKQRGSRQRSAPDTHSLDIHSLAVRMYCALDKVADYVDALRVVPFDDREEVQAYCEEFRNTLWRAYADLLRLIAEVERAYRPESESHETGGIVVAFPSRGDKP